MNYTALAAELTDDTLARGYSAMTDAEAAADLNTVYRTRLRPLSMMELREWAGLNARGFKIYSAISDGTKTDQQRNVAYVADKLLGTDNGTLDPRNDLHVAMVDTLVSAGIISADDKAALVAKATDNISRANELGLGTIREGDIQVVRPA